MLSCFSHIWLFATLWTIARQAPLSMGFSRQEYWSGLLCPAPWDLSNLETEPTSLTSTWIGMDSLPLGPIGKPQETAPQKKQKLPMNSEEGNSRKQLERKTKEKSTDCILEWAALEVQVQPASVAHGVSSNRTRIHVIWKNHSACSHYLPHPSCWWSRLFPPDQHNQGWGLNLPVTLS